MHRNKNLGAFGGALSVSPRAEELAVPPTAGGPGAGGGGSHPSSWRSWISTRSPRAGAAVISCPSQRISLPELIGDGGEGACPSLPSLVHSGSQDSLVLSTEFLLDWRMILCKSLDLSASVSPAAK